MEDALAHETRCRHLSDRQLLLILLRNQEQMMSTEQDLQTSLDGIQTDVATISTTISGLQKSIADLTAQLAAGSPVSQAQLDALATEAASAKTALDAVASPPVPPTARRR